MGRSRLNNRIVRLHCLHIISTAVIVCMSTRPPYFLHGRERRLRPFLNVIQVVFVIQMLFNREPGMAAECLRTSCVEEMGLDARFLLYLGQTFDHSLLCV